ncbi:MAG: M48 family metallopeptidase [Zoogloeaceae bacterium]|jgi:Zn-dependent protease with chaperone function|nr:M48 family metallopeptidase [Zoogloeaceae bacterium]
MNMEAFYFDGRSSKRHTVRLEATAGRLCLHDTPEGERHFDDTEVKISEPQGRAPRVLSFPDGACCEVAQGAELDALLNTLGYRESFVMRLQGNWPVSLFALVCVILMMAAAYQWGLPWGAEIAAPHIPIKPMQQLSDTVLRKMDGEVLHPSKLPLARQEKLRSGFNRLVALDAELAVYAPNPRLIFRSAPDVGPNAFAMPGGQIVLFDELAEELSDDEALAVLSHELGHLNRRHSVRQLIQSSVSSAVLAAYFGDVSAAAAYLATLALDMSYSREMELEADAYGAAALRRQNKSPMLLASALEKLERSTRHVNNEDEDDEENEDEDEDEGTDEDSNEEEDGASLGWLSSHPDTRERIRRLKEL